MISHTEIKSNSEVQTMAKRTTYHVTGKRGNWNVKRAGASRATSNHASKADAIAEAKTRAKAAPKGQIVIHRSDNVIQTEHTYGDDPNPPKG